MADKYHISKAMPGLNIRVLNQKDCECCWAISVAATVSSALYSEYRCEKYQVSPKDILDRTWFYQYDEEEMMIRDTAGCFRWGLKKALELVRDYGVGYMDDYPFRPSLDENKGPIKTSEYPRIHIADFKVKMKKSEVIDTLKNENRTVIGVLYVTRAFADLKEGIYKASTVVPPTVLPPTPLGPAVRPRTKVGRHAVVIEGFNEDEQYFDIKNSYGLKWGVNGCGKVDMDAFIAFACPVSAYKLDYAP